MKKLVSLFAVALVLVASATLAVGVYTNTLGQVVTVSGSEGAYATVSTGTAVSTPETYRSGITVFVDTNVAPDAAATIYTAKATIGDMLIGTFSNKVWVMTRTAVFTPVN